MRSNNGLQARFAATSQLLYSDIWPIWLVVVPGNQGSRSITRLGYAIGGWIIQLSNVA